MAGSQVRRLSHGFGKAGRASPSRCVSVCSLARRPQAFAAVGEGSEGMNGMMCQDLRNVVAMARIVAFETLHDVSLRLRSCVAVPL